MLKRYPVQRTRRNKPPIIFSNFHLEALADKLTTAAAIGKRRQSEFVWIGLGKRVYIQPAHLVGQRHGRVRLDGSVEELVNALEKSRACQLRTEVGREALVPIQDT